MAEEEMSFTRIITLIVGAAIGMIVLFAIWGSFVVINPGYVGVIFNTAAGTLRSAPQGFAFKLPFISRVQEYPVALRTYTMVKRSTGGSSKEDDSLDLPTREGQHIRQDVSVTYNTSDTKAVEVFKSFRGQEIEDIENTFIRRTVITITQNAAGQMSLTELISSKRGEFQANISEQLAKELGKMGFVLDKVNLGASHLPDIIEAQMQDKMKAQQEALKADYELQKQTTLAKAKVAEAIGTRDANNIMQASITPAVLELKKIEKWDGRLPQVVGASKTLIDIGGK